MSSPRPLRLAQARRLHGENGRWRNFARRILHQPEIRRQLWQRQQGRCAHCGRRLTSERLSIHHLSYEHFCITDQADRVRGERGRRPPCDNCNQLSSCLERLEALCRLCHRRRHRPSSHE